MLGIAKEDIRSQGFGWPQQISPVSSAGCHWIWFIMCDIGTKSTGPGWDRIESNAYFDDGPSP